MAQNEQTSTMLMEVAERIRGLREIAGFSQEEMASKTDIAVDTYASYESGVVDLPFTFIHKCAQLFGVELTELLEGSAAHLSPTRSHGAGKGDDGPRTGIEIRDLGPFSGRSSSSRSGSRTRIREEQQYRPIKWQSTPDRSSTSL